MAHPAAARPAAQALTSRYLRAQRHILLDMHVPDFEDAFLRDFDPVSMADLYARAGADAVMVYANSHAGQCYWPTATGRMHAGLRGRDVFGETVDRLHERGISVCAYYSSHFNTWAYTEHPDWRVEPAAPGSRFGAGSRYGICCPNNPDYHAFQLAQTDEIAGSYPVDAVFFDMVFWTDVCVCAHCGPGPAAVDWFSPEWCAFQASREGRLASRFADLAARVKSHRAVPVFCNGAMIPMGWRSAASEALLDANDLIGGDYQASRDGLYAYCHLIARRSPSVMQYMNASSGYIGGDSHLKPVEDQTTRHALVSTLFGGQFMAIDAVQPRGTVNPAFYERLAQAFDAMRPHEQVIGGTPVADVAVYWSLASQVSFAENGTPVERLSFGRAPPSPHTDAVVGAVTALRDAHVPVGVVSRPDLDDVHVLVLPNVLRMSHEEVDAIRAWVHDGGRLYASGWTSLVTQDGVRHDDFLLADVFGCHAAGVEDAAIAYLRPDSDEVSAWIAPLRSMAVRPGLRVTTDAEVLARLTLPYAGGRGTRDDRDWASSHASPPWEDTDRPLLVRHSYGAGVVVYGAADIEAWCATRANEAARTLFRGIVRSLMPEPFTSEVDADEDVWVVGFRERGGLRLNLLNQLPSRPVPRIGVRVRGAPATELHGLARFASVVVG